MVIDYRRVNSCMIPDSYPIPRLWSNIQNCAGRKWYIALDLHSGFWNVPVAEECKHLTAFITPMGLFEFNVVPFGIRNSPAEFQRAMDQAFASIIGVNCFVYVDDVVICANTVEECVDRLEQFLKLCRETGFYIRLDKCEFLKQEINYLGFSVGEHGIRPQVKRVQDIARAEPPKSKSELRAFLGLAGQFRYFIPRFSDITAPLCHRLKKVCKKWDWTEECTKAFEAIKRELTKETMLKPSVPGQPYVVYTDASEVGIGAILMQSQNGVEVPIEYGSKKLTETETRWDTRERELFAIKWAIEHWRDYLALSHFTVKTDHNNLRYLITAEKGKVFRWAIYLAQFDFDIQFIKGTQNNVADYLSRYGFHGNDDDETLDKICLQVNLIRARVQLPALPTPQQVQELALKEYPVEGLAHVIRRNGQLIHYQTGLPWIPPSMRDGIIANFHYGRHAHSSVNKTSRKIQRLYYWHNLYKDVADFIRSCLICARIKNPPAILQKIETGSLEEAIALQLVSLDHIGPLVSSGVSWHILVIIDHATRFMVADVTTSLTAAVTLKFFEDRWIRVFGPPHIVLTDGGTSFKSTFHGAVTTVYGAKHFTAAAYRPQGNGVNERSHRSLRSMVQAVCYEYAVPLPIGLCVAVEAYNNTPHSSIGVSPFEALFGRPPIYPCCQAFTGLPSESQRKAMQRAQMHQGAVNVALQQRALQPSRDIAIGDIVVVLNSAPGSATTGMMASLEGESSWTQATWTLPMKVVDVTETQVVLQQYGFGRGTITRHKDHVKKFAIPQGETTKDLLRNCVQLTFEMMLPKEGSKRRRTVNSNADAHSDEIVGRIMEDSPFAGL